MATQIAAATTIVSGNPLSLDFVVNLSLDSTINTILPNLLLISACPLYIFEKTYIFNGNHNVSFWNKMAIALFVVAMELIELLFFSPSYPFSSLGIAARAFSSYSIAVIVLALSISRRLSLQPDDLALAHFGATVFFNGLRLRSDFLENGIGVSGVLQVVAIAFKLFLLHSDLNDDDEPTFSGLWTHGFFLWMRDMMCFQNALDPTYIKSIKRQFRTKTLAQTFRRKWNQVDRPGRYSLLFTVLSLYWKQLFLFLPARVLFSACLLSQPYIVFYVLEAMQKENTTNSQKEALIAATVLVYAGILLFRSIYGTMIARGSMIVHGTLSSAIFGKTLNLPAEDASKAIAITRIATDLEQLANKLITFHWIFVCLFEVAFATYTLYTLVGYSGIFLIVPNIVATFFASKFPSDTAYRDWNIRIEERVSQTTHILSQVKEIKLLGFQDVLAEYIQKLRLDELVIARKYRLAHMLNFTALMFCEFIAPVVVLAVALGSNELSFPLQPSQIFAALMTIQVAGEPATAFLELSHMITSALEHSEKIQDYLLSRDQVDLRQRAVYTIRNQQMDRQEDGEPVQTTTLEAALSIELFAADIRPNADMDIVLRAVDVSIPASQLTIAIGLTGSGKSTFLKALIGEAHIQPRQIFMEKGPVAYCDQKAWLYHGTIRDNIIGQSNMDESWYQSILRYCCLIEDLEQLPDGDQTMVGNKGTALSGGQCQRIAMARALFSKASIMIWDDVFSAVDNRVGAQIFSTLFGDDGVLRNLGTTVVLATHSTQYFSAADTILYFDERGNVTCRQGAGIRTASIGGLPDDKTLVDESENVADIQTVSEARLEEVVDEVSDEEYGDSIGHYMFFLNSAPWWMFTLHVVITIILAAMERSSTAFMAVWVEWYPESPAMLAIYAVLGFLPSIGYIAMAILYYQLIVPRFADEMHKKLVNTMMGATLSYLTAANHGILINRISQDMTLITQEFGTTIFKLPYCCTCALADLAMVAFSSLYLLPTVPALVVLLYFLIQSHQRVISQINDLSVKNNNTLFNLLAEICSGVEHIRSFEWRKNYTERSFKDIDQTQAMRYLQHLARKWAASLADGTNMLIVVLVVVAALFRGSSTSPNQIGLAFIGIKNLGETLDGVVRFYNLAQSSIGALARLRSFVNDTPQEIDDENPVQVPDTWPRVGVVEFNNVTAKYKVGRLSYTALRNVSFEVSAKMKAGFVGRTGGGKSSIILTLMNLLDYEGSIKVDGIEISRVPRNILRQRITSTPQQTLVLPGTIRQNLMPWLLTKPRARQADERTLLKVMVRTHLRQKIEDAGGLDADMKHLGLSIGERQLFSVARAILTGLNRQSKVVVMDEATSNMDLGADDSMHDVIKQAFEGKTILMVAHRLETLDDATITYRVSNGRLRVNGVKEDLDERELGDLDITRELPR